MILLREGDGPIRRPSSAALRHGVEIGLTVVLAIQAAHLIWTAFAPLGPLGRPSLVNAAAPRADLAVLARFDPFHRGVVAAVSDQPAAETATLRLYGVRAGAGGGSAIIGGPDGKQKAYMVGETVAQGVTLQSVAGDHVVLAVNGRATKLTFQRSDAAAPAPPAAPALYTPPAAAPPADIAGLVQPRVEGGRVTGLQVRAGDGLGPLVGAGLQAGDVVVSVNGKPVSAPDAMGTELANSNQATVEYERGGERRTATLRMPRP